MEEEEELEMFHESTDRFEHSSWRPQRFCRPRTAAAKTGGAARSRTANKSRTWTRQCRRSWLSPSRTSCSSLWVHHCHRSWEIRDRCADHTTGGCACSRTPRIGASKSKEVVVYTNGSMVSFMGRSLDQLSRRWACKCHFLDVARDAARCDVRWWPSTCHPKSAGCQHCSELFSRKVSSVPEEVGCAELLKVTAEQLVDVPMPKILGISWQVCRSYHRGACLRALSFEERLAALPDSLDPES